MDKATLVALDFAIGAKMLKILDQSDLDISLAMWLHAAEYGDWRFALASKQFDAVPRLRAYQSIHEALEKAGFRYEDTPSLLIIPMSDPFIREMRRATGKRKINSETHLGSQMIADRFVEEALIYRLQ